MNAASFVEPYFTNKWWDGELTAAQALEQGKAAAVNVLRREIEAVEALTFEAFAQRCLHESVKQNSVRGGDE